MVRFIPIALLLFSCNRVKQYDCVCYYNIGTDSVSYESYVTKNNKLNAKKYCDMISTLETPCWVSE